MHISSVEGAMLDNYGPANPSFNCRAITRTLLEALQPIRQIDSIKAWALLGRFLAMRITTSVLIRWRGYGCRTLLDSLVKDANRMSRRL
jgi:hypothetical protein